MGAYTNANINFYDNRYDMLENIAELEFKNKRLQDRIGYLRSFIENIPFAIEKYGYVDLDVNNEGKITLIKKPEVEE